MKLAREWKPDLIHVHFAVPAGALAWILRRLTGIPYVLTAHLGDVPGGVPEKTGRWFRWIYPFTPPIWKKSEARGRSQRAHPPAGARTPLPRPDSGHPQRRRPLRPGARKNSSGRSTANCVRRQVRPAEKPLADHPHPCPATASPLALRDGGRWTVASRRWRRRSKNKA